MSVKDLIAGWEEALAMVLSQPGGQEDAVTELYDGDLINVADQRIARIRSNVRAGPFASFADCAGATQLSACCV